MDEFYRFANEQFKIKVQSFTGKHSQKLKWTDFTGHKRLMTVLNLLLEKLFLNYKNSHVVHQISDDFMMIYDMIRQESVCAEQVQL